MTTKEIAEAVGRDERSVRRWVKAVADKMTSVADKMSASNSTYPADYDLSETLAIIEHGMGKNAAALYRMNVKQREPETISEIVKATVLALVPAIVAAIKGAAPQDAPMLPAPKLSLRDELRRLVAKSAPSTGGYREAWARLYQEIYYRMHRNVRECAKNRGMDTLDYIEEEGILPEVIAIARETLGAA